MSSGSAGTPERAASGPLRWLANRVLEAAGRGLIAGVSRLPPRMVLRLGAGLGALAARCRLRTAVARVNLRLALPELDEAGRRRLLLTSYRNLGRCLAEWILLQGPARERILSDVTVVGFERIEAALAQGRGALLLTAHLGNWELGVAAAARAGLPLSIVYHGRSQGWIERLTARAREGPGAADLEQLRMGESGLRALRALRRGRCLAVLLDQNAHREEGIFVPFFSHLACTRRGAARLAMITGARVLPVFLFRSGGSGGHRLRIGEPLALESAPAGDEAALRRNVARMNEAIEGAIREAPEQWLWGHRRWRTRPRAADLRSAQSAAESAPVYPSRRRRPFRARSE